MKFKMEDVRIDIKTIIDGQGGEFWEWQQYTMIHMPTNNFVCGWGTPLVPPKEKETMIRRLKKKVKNAT